MTDKNFYNRIRIIAQRTPNDADLGAIIRAIIWDVEESKGLDDLEVSENQYTLQQMINEVEQENRENNENRL